VGVCGEASLGHGKTFDRKQYIEPTTSPVTGIVAVGA
jgi:hypothetical protein